MGLLTVRDARLSQTIAGTLITIRITIWQTASYLTRWETNKNLEHNNMRNGFLHHDEKNEIHDEEGQTTWHLVIFLSVTWPDLSQILAVVTLWWGVAEMCESGSLYGWLGGGLGPVWAGVSWYLTSQHSTHQPCSHLSSPLLSSSPSPQVLEKFKQFIIRNFINHTYTAPWHLVKT